MLVNDKSVQDSSLLNIHWYRTCSYMCNHKSQMNKVIRRFLIGHMYPKDYNALYQSF